jgi:hypothetical protein
MTKILSILKTKIRIFLARKGFGPEAYVPG